jgi:DNA-binding NarL/FixJ family response regulator
MNILVVDDDENLRHRITLISRKNAKFDFITNMSNYADVLMLLETKNPEIVLIDLSKPYGMMLLRHLKSKYPSTKTLVYRDIITSFLFSELETINPDYYFHKRNQTEKILLVLDDLVHAAI